MCSQFIMRFAPHDCLLKVTTVENVVALEGLVSPESLELGLALGGRNIHLGVSVVLSIRVVHEALRHLIGTTGQVATRDLERSGLLVLTVQEDGTHGPLTGTVASLREATESVLGFPVHSVVAVVVVTHFPESPAFGVEPLVKGLEESRVERLLSPVQLLDSVKVHLGLGKQGQGVLGLLLLGLLGLGSFLLGLLLLLLLGCGNLLGLGGVSLPLGELNGTNHGLDGGLVDDQVEPTDNVAESLQVTRGEHQTEHIDQSSGEGDVGHSQLVANDVGVSKQMTVQSVQSGRDVSLSLSIGLADEGHGTLDGQQPERAGSFDLKGGKVHPLLDERRLVKAVAVQVSVSTDASNVASDGMRTGEGTLGGLQHGGATVLGLNHFQFHAI